MGVKGAERQPAPNAYNRDSKNGVLKAAPSFGFGTSKRPATADARGVPGPGSYQHRSVMGTDTQGKSLACKLAKPKTSDMLTPGPGTYNGKFESGM